MGSWAQSCALDRERIDLAALKKAALRWERTRASSDTWCTINHGEGGQDSNPNEPHDGLPVRTNSQLSFDGPQETVIVFDFDDTIFPTSFLLEHMLVNIRLPVSQQNHINVAERERIQELLNECESQVVETLTECLNHGHVFIVTLAMTGRVDIACSNFFPNMG